MAEDRKFNPYDIADFVARATPMGQLVSGGLKGMKEGFEKSGREGVESYFGALNNDYKPPEAVSMLDSGEYIDKDGKIIPEAYRPNVLPVTKAEKGKGWFGSDYEGAMPGMAEFNIIGNPFKTAGKGTTLGSGFTRRATKDLEEIDLERLLEETKDWKSPPPKKLTEIRDPITPEELLRQQREKDQDYSRWYHGTTHDIPESGMSIEKGNIENYLGKYPHISSSPYDASKNYAGMGPDLRGRVEQLADRYVNDIFQETGIDGDAAYKQAMQLATEELKGPHEGAVLPISARMKNPVRVTPEKPTWLDLSYTDYGDDGMHPSNMLQKLESSLDKLGKDYGFNSQQVLSELADAGLIGDEVRADKFYKALRNSLEGNATDDAGNHATGHVASELFHMMGFDGIIMDASKTFPRMDMQPGTLHAAIFEPGNIRSTFAKFDPEHVGKEGLLLGRGMAPMPRSPYDNEERNRAAGGQIPFGVRESAKSLSRAGLINSSTAGRTDKLSGNVKAGSYVFPADVVSAMGQGNTMAGAHSLSKLLGMGPYGSGTAKPPRGRGMTAQKMKGFKSGGRTEEVPVNVSGGEFIAPPEVIARLGGGDIDYGHEIADALAMEVRRKAVSTLTKLPPPRKD